MNELEKYGIIKSNRNKQRATLTLGLSIRQINPPNAGYKVYGKVFCTLNRG